MHGAPDFSFAYRAPGVLRSALAANTIYNYVSLHNNNVIGITPIGFYVSGLLSMHHSVAMWGILQQFNSEVTSQLKHY